MEVNSKYNINDTVWVVNRNKVIQQKIQSVETTSYVNEKEIVKTEIEYTFIGGDKLPEDRVFKTKQELIDTL